MKVHLFPITVGGNYRLESFSPEDAAGFIRQTTCPACESKAEPKLLAMIGGNTLEEALKLVCCKDCGHITYDRLPSEPWLEQYYGQTWDKLRRKVSSTNVKLKPTNSSPWAFAKHFLDLDLPFEARILDFGCGWGDGLLSLQHLGYKDIFGVEVGTHRVEVATRYFPGRIKCGSLGEAQEFVKSSGPFDAIILNHVAEHLRDPYQVLCGLIPLLKPQGMIVVSVPNIYSESPIHLSLYFPHLHHFNATSMLRLMKRAGLNSFRWTSSETQLAVAGSLDHYRKPPKNYSNEELTVNDEFAKKIAEYIRVPWRTAQSTKPIYLCYFHPWTAPQHWNGFQHVGRSVASWINLGRYTVFPLIGLSQKLGLDRRRLAYRAFLMGSRIFFGKDALIGGETIGFQSLTPTETEVPWLTTAEGKIGVLVK